MVVAVVGVRIMFMGVFQRFVDMGVRMELPRRHVSRVVVPVMGIVGMLMFVNLWIMSMPMDVIFRQMQPHPDAH